MKKKAGNKTYKLWTAAALSTIMVTSLLSGCGGGDKGGSSSGSSKAELSDSVEAKENTYPLKFDDTFTYWGVMRPNIAPNFTNMGDTHIGKQWQKQTGVKIKFEHPVTGQDTEQFNLILADGNYPDLWDYDWRSFPGGPAKALDDGVILELNDLINEHCPNLKKYLKDHPEVARTIKTDDGRYYSFPSLRDVYASYLGPLVRSDWLKKCNLEVPETIDEWHDVLTAFKDQMGASAPFTASNKSDTFFAYAYGVQNGFFLDDGKVVFGPAKKEYKEYMKTMHQWYDEGLIDPDYFASGEDETTAKMTTGRSGVTSAWAASGMMNYIPIGQETEPEYDLTATKNPVLKKGETPEYGYIENPYYYGGLAIGATCKDPVTAAEVLDYGYGEEGHMMFNFGEEGVSYTMENDNPVYTDVVWKNENGWPVSQAIADYILAYSFGPFVQDSRYQEQYLYMDQAKEAIKTWADTNAKEHLMPEITRTSDESSEYATIMNDIGTYVGEMSAKFIMGTEDIDSGFDKYLDTLNQMGLEQAVEINTAAYERYQKR